MKRHLRWWRSFHISHASDKVGGGDTLGAGEEAPPCSESFSLHVNWRCSCSSLHDAMLRSFSGEGSASWSLSLWAFSSSSELKLVPQGSHLGYKTTITDLSDFGLCSFLSYFLFFSLLSWLFHVKGVATNLEVKREQLVAAWKCLAKSQTLLNFILVHLLLTFPRKILN